MWPSGLSASVLRFPMSVHRHRTENHISDASQGRHAGEPVPTLRTATSAFQRQQHVSGHARRPESRQSRSGRRENKALSHARKCPGRAAKAAQLMSPQGAALAGPAPHHRRPFKQRSPSARDGRGMAPSKDALHGSKYVV